MNQLTPITLTECESVIESGMAAFVEVGNALMTIRDQRLYKQDYSSFESYCQERWGWSRAHAYRHIAAAEVANVSPMGDILNERQARALSPLKDDQQAIQEVIDEIRKDEKPVTASAIQRKVEQIVKRNDQNLHDAPVKRDVDALIRACNVIGELCDRWDAQSMGESMRTFSSARMDFLSISAWLRKLAIKEDS